MLSAFLLLVVILMSSRSLARLRYPQCVINPSHRPSKEWFVWAWTDPPGSSPSTWTATWPVADYADFSQSNESKKCRTVPPSAKWECG